MDMQEITVSRTKEYRQYESFKQKNIDVLLDSGIVVLRNYLFSPFFRGFLEILAEIQFLLPPLFSSVLNKSIVSISPRDILVRYIIFSKKKKMHVTIKHIEIV